MSADFIPAFLTNAQTRGNRCRQRAVSKGQLWTPIVGQFGPALRTALALPPVAAVPLATTLQAHFAQTLHGSSAGQFDYLSRN
jgi:hypothetical protein